jgi:tRNA (mo5U34)-methyltransferase
MTPAVPFGGLHYETVMSRNPEQIERLKRTIATVESWYHRIDLGDGIETPGPLRMSEYLGYYNFPERMDGMRVLDVGASNGFFAYEFERRGAAEVVAVELPNWKSHDWTPRYRKRLESRDESTKFQLPWRRPKDGFDVVGEALGSTRVKRIRKPVYELSSSDLGLFDIVFSGAMLMHVRDPVLGIQRDAGCCRLDGRLIVSISTLLTPEEGPIADSSANGTNATGGR